MVTLEALIFLYRKNISPAVKIAYKRYLAEHIITIIISNEKEKNFPL